MAVSDFHDLGPMKCVNSQYEYTDSFILVNVFVLKIIINEDYCSIPTCLVLFVCIYFVA